MFLPHLRCVKCLQEHACDSLWVLFYRRCVQSKLTKGERKTKLLSPLPVWLSRIMHRQPACVAARAAVARCIVVCALRGSRCTGIWRIRRCPPSLLLIVGNVLRSNLCGHKGCKVTFGPLHHFYFTALRVSEFVFKPPPPPLAAGVSIAGRRS